MNETTTKKKPPRKHVNIFLQREIHELFKKRAAQESLSLTAWIRSTCVKELRKTA